MVKLRCVKNFQIEGKDKNCDAEIDVNKVNDLGKQIRYICMKSKDLLVVYNKCSTQTVSIYEMTDKTGKIDHELAYLDTVLFNKIIVLVFQTNQINICIVIENKTESFRVLHGRKYILSSIVINMFEV